MPWSIRSIARAFGSLVLGVSLVALCLPAQAHAQARAQFEWVEGTSGADGTKGWMIVRYGNGCSLVLYQHYLAAAWGGYSRPDFALTVDGGCDASGLASGTIRITHQWTSTSTFDGSVQNNRFVAVASAANGLLQGMSEETDYEKDESGQWVLAYRGDVRNPMPSFFRNGCPYYVEDGRPDFSAELTDGCKEAEAQVALAKWAGASGKTPPALAIGSPAAGFSSGSTASDSPPANFPAPTTFTSVAGVPVTPATFPEPQERALAMVAEGLVAALGGREGLAFTGGNSIETVIASLRTTLGLNSAAALGGRRDLLDLVLTAVRNELSGSNPALTKGQVADFTMNALRLAIENGTRPPPTAQAAGAAPVQKLVSARNIQSVVDYLASKGDQAAREVDIEGDPRLRVSGGLYHVFFYNCGDAHDSCDRLQFFTCYSQFPNASTGRANAWNRDYLAVKVYIDDEGQVCLSNLVVTGATGVPYDVMDATFGAFLFYRQNVEAQFQ